jgi:hypothetical protein
MDRQDKQLGYVVVTVAMLLVVFLGFGALATDVGILLSARTAAQAAADAGALAGAFTFVTNTSAAQPSTAYDHAMSTALSNDILAQSITAPEVTVNVDVGNRRVTVDINRTQGTFLARALGVDSADIGVRAIAEASPEALAAFCAKPWFIPNTIIGDPSQTPCENCNLGQVLIDGNGVVTQFGLDQIAADAPFTIKPGNPQAALGPGQFYAIRMGDSTGGNDYRTNIYTCSPEVLSCQAVYGAEPGNMIGPTKQGVNELIGSPPDVYYGVGEYLTSSGMSNTSRSLIVAPIWDVCLLPGFCPANKLPDNGANVQIPVRGFALIFIDGVQGNDVIAHLVGISGCGAGGPPLGSEVTGPYSVPVRLVRLP